MKKSFTLVEIMIVIAVVAILAAIAIPGLLRARINANDNNAQATLKTIANAFENYSAAQDGNYPTAISDLTDSSPPYLNEDYTAAVRHGYNYACPAMTTTSYSCTATPVSCNTSGTKTYTITTGAVLSSASCSG